MPVARGRCKKCAGGLTKSPVIAGNPFFFFFLLLRSSPPFWQEEERGAEATQQGVHLTASALLFKSLVTALSQGPAHCSGCLQHPLSLG